MEDRDERSRRAGCIHCGRGLRLARGLEAALREHQLSAGILEGIDAGSFWNAATPLRSGEPTHYDVHRYRPPVQRIC